MIHGGITIIGIGLGHIDMDGAGIILDIISSSHSRFLLAIITINAEKFLILLILDQKFINKVIAV